LRRNLLQRGYSGIFTLRDCRSATPAAEAEGWPSLKNFASLCWKAIEIRKILASTEDVLADVFGFSSKKCEKLDSQRW
jgi:hypothetical protein